MAENPSEYGTNCVAKLVKTGEKNTIRYKDLKLCKYQGLQGFS